MELTKVQLKTLIGNHIKREGGLQEVMEMMLNAMMKSERTAHLEGAEGNKANGYRYGKTYGQGRILELRIPRDRNGEFYPKVLALLRSQQAEIDQLVSALYGQGLTQRQIGRVFDDLYGRHYSPSTISRMIEWMREEVGEWLKRPVESYYPVVFIDAIQVSVRRDTVQKEAFYVVLGVTQERKREVLGIVHFPTESATGWEMVLAGLKKRGMRRIGLLVADGLTGIEEAVSQVYSGTPVQWCVTHIKRGLLARVRSRDKQELAEDLRWVFRTDDRQDSPEAGWQRWQQMCRRWQDRYQAFAKLASEQRYRNGFTYLGFDYRIRSMIYTTNWIERLNRKFRGVLKNRSSMPDEESVRVLLGHVAMDQPAYARRLPRMQHEKRLFRDSSVPDPEQMKET